VVPASVVPRTSQVVPRTSHIVPRSKNAPGTGRWVPRNTTVLPGSDCAPRNYETSPTSIVPPKSTPLTAPRWDTQWARVEVSLINKLPPEWLCLIPSDELRASRFADVEPEHLRPDQLHLIDLHHRGGEQLGEEEDGSEGEEQQGRGDKLGSCSGTGWSSPQLESIVSSCANAALAAVSPRSPSNIGATSRATA